MLAHTKFFTFSGYTKGLAVVKKIPDKDSNTFELELRGALREIFRQKFNKELLSEEKPYITIDGVMVKVINLNSSLKSEIIDNKYYLSVEVEGNSFEPAPLRHVEVEQEVSIGLPALRVDRFLTKNYPMATARLINFDSSYGINEPKLTFSTSRDFAEQYIKVGHWVGINGSSFTVTEVENLDCCAKFTVQVKSERTRILTLFGSAEAIEDIKEVNLTPGVADDQIKASDFKPCAPFNPKKFGLA